MKIKINEKDWQAICSLVDLGLECVVNSEDDYLEHSGRKRRNGGYSADKRQWYKCETRVAKQLFKVYKKDNL